MKRHDKYNIDYHIITEARKEPLLDNKSSYGIDATIVRYIYCYSDIDILIAEVPCYTSNLTLYQCYTQEVKEELIKIIGDSINVFVMKSKDMNQNSITYRVVKKSS